MDNYLLFLPLGFLFLWILLGIAGSNLARKRNRNEFLWFMNCLLSGLLGILVIATAPSLEFDEDLDYKETDTLGWIIFVVSLIMLVLSIRYWYAGLTEYQTRMFWDSIFMVRR